MAMSEAQKRYVERNRELIKKRRAEHYQKNKQREIQNNKKYYLAHREKIKKYRHQYYEDNKEESSLYRRKYRESHKEETKECSKKYYESHKEEYYQYTKEYRKRKFEEKIRKFKLYPTLNRWSPKFDECRMIMAICEQYDMEGKDFSPIDVINTMGQETNNSFFKYLR